MWCIEAILLFWNLKGLHRVGSFLHHVVGTGVISDLSAISSAGRVASGYPGRKMLTS